MKKIFSGLILALSLPVLLDAKPLVLGHRGACGYRPEHTLASYQLAIDMGADYIEPDLVSTKDGVLIARHENEISETTDVAVKFPDRKATKTIDGKTVIGWFTEDFTLKEIKTLRAKERLAFRDHSFDGQFEVPTFKEVIALAQTQSKKLKRTIGLYPETKHPTYFQSLKLSLEEPLAKELKAAGLNKKSSAVFIQSFELGNLKRLKTLTKNKLVFLIDDPEIVPADFQASGDKRIYLQLMTPEGLKEIKKTADGIGPYKRYLLPTKTITDKSGEKTEEKLAPTPLVKLAHAVGLLVHPYTFRSEEKYLLKSYNKDPQAEYLEFFALGVDGVFTDFPDHAVKARENYLKSITKKETR
ncbi:MAG: glycerophosphodiester phosphodiesterase [Bdellovibrionota bacterium]